MPGPSVTWMPVPAPRGYLVNPYKQGDTMTESSDYESVQVFIGVDVGKDT
ncbi:TPA: GlcNAc transferase, partial [Escherichia coli]|nr:GlcNAc transferase [Escherichia coli]HDI9157492.1 GlcNAc transferase [Escherichia coli]